VYNAHFSLSQSPFRLTPDPAFFYVTSQHREALAGLVHSLRSRSGLAVLTGEAGTGKTTVLHVIRKWMNDRHFVVAMLTNPTLSREEFYDMLLAQMEVQCTSPLKSRQLLSLEQALTAYGQQGRRPVLIVDEAHRLSPELIDEVRLLLNLETPEEKLMDIIMAGQPELADMLRRPELRQFKQRVSYFCRLEPLTRAEAREYIDHRQAKAGNAGPTLFPDDTIGLIHEYTKGIPRLVNTLCDSALRIAFAFSARTVTPSIVIEAAADLDLIETKRESGFPRNGSMSGDDYASRQASLNMLAALTDFDK
jgi:general secretion pathway protein A